MLSSGNERVFILDSNAYLRLADVLHPLLDLTFGDPPAKLITIPEVNEELSRSHRLRSHFAWANQGDFIADRKKNYPKIDRKTHGDVISAWEYLSGTARSEGLIVSPTDKYVLAYALVLGYKVVSDDRGMRQLAELYQIPMIGVIDFLIFLYDEGGASIETIQEVVDVMERRDDIPDPKTFFSKFGKLCQRAASL
ncbi:MAG: hypothetical protein ABFC75_00355 [Rectinema sp.]